MRVFPQNANQDNRQQFEIFRIFTEIVTFGM